MKEIKYLRIFNIIFMALIMSLLILVLVLALNLREADKIDCRSCDIRFNVNESTGINGVYNHPEYFCVWTKDRSPEAIAKTTFHEMSHYFIHNDPEHFEVSKK